MRLRSRLAVAAAFFLVVAACSGGDASPTTTTNSTPTSSSTTTVAPSTSTGDSTTTTASGPTSTITYAAFDVFLQTDPEARAVITGLYGWIGDRTQAEPDVPVELLAHLSTASVSGSETIDALLHWADVGEGRAGVVTAGDDVILLADEGAGWKIVGASLPRFELGPWFGDPLRYVLVIGTDARPGQDQENFRADSLHILSSNVAETGGGILGIPRDTYVEAPYGSDKFTNVNVYSGQETMVDLASELSGLPLEGYFVTGFVGFQQLVNAFGGVNVDVPFGMADQKSQAFISAGYQLLWGDKALGFSRNRNISGSDFTRSFHQGIVIAAGLQGALDRDITALPSLLAMLDAFTWTNLDLGDLVTIGAGAFLLDSSNVGNAVLPGTITTRGGASVVVLTDGSEDLFRDLDDGVLTPTG